MGRRGWLAADDQRAAAHIAEPVELDPHAERQLPEPVEVATYYVVSEVTSPAGKGTTLLIEVPLEDHRGAVSPEP